MVSFSTDIVSFIFSLIIICFCSLLVGFFCGYSSGREDLLQNQIKKSKRGNK